MSPKRNTNIKEKTFTSVFVHMYKRNGRNINEIKITKNHRHKTQIPIALDRNEETDRRNISTQSSDKCVMELSAESNLLINTFLKKLDANLSKSNMIPNKQQNQDDSENSFATKSLDSLKTSVRQSNEASFENFTKETHRDVKCGNPAKKPRKEIESSSTNHNDTPIFSETPELKAIKTDYVNSVVGTTLTATVADSENDRCYETCQLIIFNSKSSESLQESAKVLEEIDGNQVVRDTVASLGEMEKPDEINETLTQKRKRKYEAGNQSDDLLSTDISSEDSLSQNRGLNNCVVRNISLTDIFKREMERSNGDMEDKNKDQKPEMVFEPLEFHSSDSIFPDVKRIKSESRQITYEPKSIKKTINNANAANIQNHELKVGYIMEDKDYKELKLESNLVSQQVNEEPNCRTPYFETSISPESSELQPVKEDEITHVIQTILMGVLDDIENKQRHEICQPVVMSTRLNSESLAKNLQILEERNVIQVNDLFTSSNKRENLNDGINKTPTENRKRRYEADSQSGDQLAGNITFQDSCDQNAGLDNCAARKKILIEICKADQEIRLENEYQEPEIVSEPLECQSSDAEQATE